ncbi:hypothetical protein BB558_000806 [Smittium angustum]|uniref:Aspartate-semialdehyde dehydrogenase n=1 Tax=Smittium angustum TaxID=133377 RepID=A0A2U1JD68_SMIAN|nr:hypothetical protein BB558_000806 [Smittium angustum]
MAQQQSRPIRAGILGATGTVGQRFIVLLSQNPCFEIHTLGASERSSGKKYSEASNWKISDALPLDIAQLEVKSCHPEHFGGCDVIFSGLDASVAGDIEKSFFESGFPVFSNAKNYRMVPNVPLIVPTVNTEHMAVVAEQQKSLTKTKGFIVTNSNCSVSGVAVVLKAIQSRFGKIDSVLLTTMQAISGAGYPGVASLDIMDNVVPYISGEEEKIEIELLKILGSTNQENTGFDTQPDLKVSASCNRVPVIDGHTASVSIKFAQNPPSLEEIKSCLREYECEAQKLGCHSAPKVAIHVTELPDRPQPRLDRMNDNGMAATVGRIRVCPVFDVKFTVLVHNTVLGAAGASILNAEAAFKKGLFQL